MFYTDVREQGYKGIGAPNTFFSDLEMLSESVDKAFI